MASEAPPLGERTHNSAREARLDELRREAGQTGRVDAAGIRAAGGPMPAAGAVAGYYGLPLLKRPSWIWTVPVYFFVGGAAGAAAIIAVVGRWTRGETPLVRDARRIAVAGGALSPVLLVADLGRPARFLNMLRVVKRQSPMSVGVWVLVAFNAAVDAASLLEYARRRSASRLLRLASSAVADAAAAAAAVLGSAVSTYTGVLVGVTAVPVWARNVRLLPFHFGMSGLASASCLLELRHDDPALHRLGLAAAAAETAVGVALEADGHRAQDPVKHGISGSVVRAGGVLSGPAALALRLGAGASRSRRRAAALVALAGSLLTRFAWIEAGKQSADDPREPLGLPPRRPERRFNVSSEGLRETS